MHPQMTKRTWDRLPGHVRRDLALARWARRPRREPLALVTPLPMRRARNP